MSIGAEKTIQMVYNIRKMFDDCGWEYMQDFFGYSYFRKAVAEDSVAEEIFCDEESRFQMMQRVIKGRMLPLLILFFTVLLPQFISCLFYTHYYLIDSLIGGVLVNVSCDIWYVLCEIHTV